MAAYTATQVAQNFTSYTVTEEALYVYTVSADGGGTATTGGTAERLYYNSASAGTVAIWWATNGQTISVSRQNYGQLIKITGFTKKPTVSLVESENGGTNDVAITCNSRKGHAYICVVTLYAHNDPSAMKKTFSCFGGWMQQVQHSSSGSSLNAMALFYDTYENTAIRVSANSGSSSEPKYKYIFEVSLPYDIEVEVDPYDSGIITGTGSYLREYQANIAATAASGFEFANWKLEYTKLDYISFPSGAYIDLEIQPFSNIYNDYELEIQIEDSSYIDGKHWFGTSLGYRYYHFTTKNNKYYWGQQGSENNGGTYSSGIHTLIYNGENSKVELDGTILATETKIGSMTTLWIGRRDNEANFVGNVYYCKLTDKKTNKIVRNCIPVIRHSDNQVGLLDLAHFKFYGNNGTGELSYGEQLEDVVLTDNPLTFDVNTNVNFTANFRSTYQITLTCDNTLGSASYSWVSSTQIRLVAAPNQNAQFDGWYINSQCISRNQVTSYTVLSDTTIEARFEPIYDVTTSVEGNGSITFTRGILDQNEIEISVLTAPNHHFVKYEVSGFTLEELNLLNQNGDLLITENDNEIMAVTFDTVIEYTETPLRLHLPRNIAIKAYIEEDDKFNVTVSSNLKYASFYISDHDVYTGTPVTVWARPFPDYYFVKWSDENYDNPRTININNSNVTLTAIYQRVTDTNGIYQYRCYVKDQLDMTALPKAFLRVTKFTIKTDLMTNANSTIHVLEEPENLNNGDVVVLYDPKGQFLYNGVIKSIDDKKITCSQMQSFYKGLWIYNVSPQDFLEHEIAVLLENYAQGRVYGCNYVDPLIAQRLGGITIDYVGTTTAKLPTDTDEQGNMNYTEKDMETFIYELYENYGIIFDFEINPAGANYVHIKVPNYSPVKVGDNMFAIKDMSPITTIEETNKLIIYAADKTYRTTYIATKSGIIEAPPTIVDRFDITKTKVVFSDDDISDLVANNLPSQMYNHKLTFTLLIKNFVYQFGDFNLGGQLDIYHKSDYYNSVLTGYEIRKEENKNITEADFICGKVRQKLTQLLTLGKV